MRLTIEYSQLKAALEKFPRVAATYIPEAIERSVVDMARSGKEFAPKADSLLTNSITHEMSRNRFEGRVIVGVRHGKPVEQGTGIYGPQGVPSGRMPPVQSILDWIRVKNVKPNDPDMSEEDLAFLIARSIAVTGTPPQPYAEPAFRHNKDQAMKRIDDAIDRLVATVH